MSWLKHLKRSAWQNPRIPAGTRIYAVGDVHGYADLLANVFVKIDTDLRQRPVSRPILVMVGDYIDRGPNSRGTIDMLLSRSQMQECIFLKGNHESFVFDFPKDPSLMLHWQNFGALNTMESYGLTASPNMTARELQELADNWRDQLPETHAEFFSRLALSFTCGDYFFVHAGVKPGISLTRQRERDLIWIRDEFLQSEEWFGKKVVHGHTPVHEPDFRPNRINIDTGVYSSGRLTCLMLEDDSTIVL